MARVVVVEDNEPISRILHAFLDREGHEVDVYELETEVFDKIDGTADLLVVDYNLAVIKGDELVTELRKRLGNIPAVIVTADAQGEVRRRVGELENSRLLLKPFTSTDLIDLVDDLLSAQKEGTQ